MQRISHSSTTFYLVFAPLSTLGLVAMWFVVALMMQSPMFWLTAIAFLVLALAVMCFAPRFRHIIVDGSHIRVSSLFCTITLPLSSIACVTEFPVGEIHRASIEFDHVTPLGRRVYFMPRVQLERVGWMRWRRIAPVVQELARSAQCPFVCAKT